jgi:hypothetical protein
MTITAAGNKPIQLETTVPYASNKQRRFFNANRNKIGGKVVDEFNQVSKGMKLPERAGKRITRKKS